MFFFQSLKDDGAGQSVAYGGNTYTEFVSLQDKRVNT